ncbi:hypothetical protein [Nonomuraea sp. NPDC049784]|uniref:hypothetical protein n=1 Tax=Nonomuraea sp. NPDC049784 TaxID=3154361 RepID=UPI0033F07E36
MNASSSRPATAQCVRAPDGYHVHVYNVMLQPNHESAFPAFVEHHLHTWAAEHQALYPDSQPVHAYRDLQLPPQPLGWYGLTRHARPLGGFDTLDQAWSTLEVSGDIPVVTCLLAADRDVGDPALASVLPTLELPQALIVDGRLACPYEGCGAVGSLEQLQVATRSNPLEITAPGVITADITPAPFDDDGVECTACTRRVALPPEFTLIED